VTCIWTWLTWQVSVVLTSVRCRGPAYVVTLGKTNGLSLDKCQLSWQVSCFDTCQLYAHIKIYVWHPSIHVLFWQVSVVLTRVIDNLIRSYMYHDSFICVPWLIHMCAMTHSYVCHDSFICVPWFIHVCAMTQSFVLTRVINNSPWQVSFIKHCFSSNKSFVYVFALFFISVLYLWWFGQAPCLTRANTWSISPATVAVRSWVTRSVFVFEYA